MIHNTSFCVIDTETSGSIPVMDRIIEIGAIIIKGGEIVDKFETLIDPGILIPTDITQFTGIDSNMVKGKPSFTDIADKFKEFIGGSIFVAHNIDFDWGFVNEEFKRSGHKPLTNPKLCTVKLTRKVFPGLPRYRLGDLSETFGLGLERAHRALDDSTATGRLLMKNLEALQNKGIMQTKEIPHLIGWIPPEQPEDQMAMW